MYHCPWAGLQTGRAIGGRLCPFLQTEWKEFSDYTGRVHYTVANKQDTTYLGRFTFDTLMDFEGLARVLTILARGFLFHEPDGSLAAQPRVRIEYARRGLCAWCSVPDKKKATPKAAWKFRTDFRELHGDFPRLVDREGSGWFHRHVHEVIAFVKANPAAVYSGTLQKCAKLESGFDNAWRDKVTQMQMPVFSPTTKGQWSLRFEDILANALYQGPLRCTDMELPDELMERLRTATPKEIPIHMVTAVVAYYIANKPDDSDWVVLPVANFDAYFGTTSFGRKILKQIPQEIMERSNTGFGICRYRITNAFR